MTVASALATQIVIVVVCFERVNDFGMGQHRMTDDEVSNDSIAASAYAEIEAVRKTLQKLYEQLAVTQDTAKEIARNELCKSLVGSGSFVRLL